MTPEQFTYWLQGYAEINEAAPNEQQWQIIKDHLQTVFLKVTPLREPQGQWGARLSGSCRMGTACRRFANHELASTSFDDHGLHICKTPACRPGLRAICFGSAGRKGAYT